MLKQSEIMILHHRFRLLESLLAMVKPRENGFIVSRHDDDVSSRTIDLPACSRDANNLGGRAINGREWRLR